jgi:transcription elongation factor GreA
MVESPSKLENQILHFSKLGKWDKVESLWPLIADSFINNPKFYAMIAQTAVKVEKRTEMRAWISLLVESLATAGKSKEILQVCLGALRVIPEFEEIRQPLLDALRAQYGKTPRVEDYLEMSGLLHEAKLYDPMTRFLQYVQYSEGQVFRHGDWGAGKVVALRPDDLQVDLEFREHGLKTFSFDGVREFLTKVPRASFLAQRLLHPDKLAEQAEQKPVEFLKFVLSNFPGKSLARADLKDELMKGIFDLAAWNRWWAHNRDAFRFDPYISFQGSPANPVMELRENPKSFHEEMLNDFLKADSFSRQSTIVSDMIKFRDKEAIPPAISARVFETLLDAYSKTAPGAVSTRVEYACLMDELAKAVGDTTTVRPVPEELLEAAGDKIAAVIGVGTLENQIRCVNFLREKHADHWSENAEHIFLTAPVRLGQWILREMIEKKQNEIAAHLAEQLLHRPYENVELFLWLVRVVREDKWKDVHIDVGALDIFNSVIDLLEDNNRRISHEDGESSKLKGVNSRLQNLLMEKHQAIIIDAFQDMELDEARRRHRAIMALPTLNETFKLSFDSAVRRVVHKLDEDLDGAGSSGGEHFVTRPAYEARQKELQRIVSVEIPENSKAIGAAAALGDLSENAEYESAKERQKVLFRRREALEDLLLRARILEPESVDTRVIGFGTAFEIRNQDNGSIERYQLLGLWDADPEKHILSYLTPFGKQFMNKKVGDNIVVTHPTGGTTRYKVLKISNALTGETSAG